MASPVEIEACKVSCKSNKFLEISRDFRQAFVIFSSIAFLNLNPPVKSILFLITKLLLHVYQVDICL